MTTDAELSDAALAFIEQSDNRKPGKLNRTVFGERGHGYLFEYNDHITAVVVTEWDPFVDDAGRFHETSWGSAYLESFIGGIAILTGTETNDEEIARVAEVIKLHLPEITGP